jgi:hypothetical protein
MKTLPIDQIKPTPAELARIGSCSDTLARYTELIQEGVELPPVTVFHDGATFWLADGRHRLAARKSLGYADIQVEVELGTERDAQLHAFKANQAHGLPARQADRKKIARILLDDEEWKNWSDRKIAEVSGLSHPTVGKMREALVKFTTPSAPSQAIPATPRMKVVSVSSTEDDGPRSEPEDQMKSYDPTEDEIQEMASLIADLTSDNERLKEQIAIGSMDITEDERIDITEQLKDLHSRLDTAERENYSLRSSRDMYMNEGAQLGEKLRKIQHVLKRKDEEIRLLKNELAQAHEKIESLGAELEIEQGTR